MSGLYGVGIGESKTEMPVKRLAPEVRVVSWNLNFRGCKAAELQGGLLRELAPDLMLLQEVNHRLVGGHP